MISLQERNEKVKNTTMSQIKLQKQQLKLYNGLRKTEIIDEFQCVVKLTSTLQKTDLMNIVNCEMHGIQRLPALWYDYLNDIMEELNLSHYKILPNKSLHDLSNYMKNIYQELPSHMTIHEKIIVIGVTDQSFNAKGVRNFSDYRKTLLVLCTFFIERFPGTYFTEILKILTGIQEVLYLPENEKSTIKILRFIYTTYIPPNLHTLLKKTF